MAEPNKKLVYVLSMIFIVLFGLPIPIASFIVSQEYKDDECLSTHDTLNMDLSQWVFGEAIYLTVLFVLGSVILTLDKVFELEEKYIKRYNNVIHVINFIFVVIYTTMGAVILVDNKDCLGDPLGDLAFAVLAITWIGESCTLGKLAAQNTLE